MKPASANVDQLPRGRKCLRLQSALREKNDRKNGEFHLQFSVGIFSIESITTTSTGPLPLCRCSPSCSSRAVKIDGPDDGVESVETFSPAVGDHSSLNV